MPGPARRPRLASLCLLALLAAQASLLGWISARNSAAIDEPAHLCAGVHALTFGRFDVYKVNPPLARVLSALPAWAGNARTNWTAYSGLPLQRDEFRLGLSFVRINPQRWALFLFSGRLVICLFLLAGTLVCFHWARALQGPAAGLLAATLWAFCPLALGYGPFISADAACAACAGWALYRFWLWLRAPAAGSALWASLTLGLALLSKFTCLLLPPVYGLIWLASRAFGARQADTAGGQWNTAAPARPENAARSAMQLVLICAGALLLVNAAFAFRGTGTALGDYAFASSYLTGNPQARGSHEAVGENRFRQTWAGAIPVPLPRDYVSGIDLQAADLDGKRNWPWFMNGEWVRGGRWYFYAQALAFKLPAGFLFLLALCAAGTLGGAIWSAGRRGASRSIAVNVAGQPQAWLAHLTLLLPVLAILGALTLNCQLAFVRYALPCVAPLCVWVAWVATRRQARMRIPCHAVAACAVCSVAGSLAAFPHSLAYFNELVGGPAAGHRYFDDSQVDWGQDLWRLRAWSDAHGEAQPFDLELHSLLDADDYGIPHGRRGFRFNLPRHADMVSAQGVYPEVGFALTGGPRPGWFAISTARIRQQCGAYDYLLKYCTPVDRVGYSILIYRILPEEARRLQRLLIEPHLRAVLLEEEAERPPQRAPPPGVGWRRPDVRVPRRGPLQARCSAAGNLAA